MSVLRYNVVSDKKPYRPREEHLRAFFANVKRGTQPVESVGQATLLSEKATTDVGFVEKNPKRVNKKRKAPDPRKTSKKSKAEDKLNGHKFA